jgi:hypothetical protein
MRRAIDSCARATSGTFAALVKSKAVTAHHTNRMPHTGRVWKRPTVELAAQQRYPSRATAAARAI